MAAAELVTSVTDIATHARSSELGVSKQNTVGAAAAAAAGAVCN